MIVLIFVIAVIVWLTHDVHVHTNDVRPLTMAQIDRLEDELITEAFNANISVELADGDEDDLDEDDGIVENPKFDIWCAEQGAHLRATCTAEALAAFMRTGKFPKNFKPTRKAPAYFLTEYVV